MNEQIISYLRDNKDQYTQESLVEQLRKAGHGEDAIARAVHTVYGTADLPPAPEMPSHNAQVKYAGFWVRFAAVIIDAIVYGIGVGILSIPVQTLSGGNESVDLVFSIFTPVLLIIYYILMTHHYQATLGKMALGIKVCDAHTLQKASLGTIVSREGIARIMQFIPFMGLLHIIVAFTEKKQGIHDMIAKTVVVHKDIDNKNNAILVVIILGAVFFMIVVIGILASIVLVSLGSAREKAQEASVKASIASTVPSAIMCMGEGDDITQPVVGQPICRGSRSLWPDLGSNGQWDGVLDADVSDETFAYSATYGENGEKSVICTETGCEFPQ